MSDTKEVTKEVLDRFEQYFDAAKQVIEQYGGDVATLGLNVLRIEAVSQLLVGLTLMSIAFVITKFTLRGIKKFKEAEENNNTYDWSDEMARLCWFHAPLLGGIAITLTVAGLFLLLNLWNWVGIFYPEMYAVYKFLL